MTSRPLRCGTSTPHRASVRSRRAVVATVVAASSAVLATTASAAPIPAGEHLTPAAARVVRAYLALGPKPLTALTPQQARNQASIQDAAASVADHTGKQVIAPVGRVRHILIPTRKGRSVLARVYTPSGKGPFPVLVYFHGGGFVIANLDTYDASARALTNGARTVVVSVAYREAPEHPFPAPINDAYDSFQWVAHHTGAVGGRAGTVSVAGESAGGTLAADVSVLARNRGGVMPRRQVLIYPVTDFTNRSDKSRVLEAADVPLDRPALGWFRMYFLPKRAQWFNPLASPICARNLRGLPPTTVLTDENDPLRSQGQAYAARLVAAGVNVHSLYYAGVMHEFFGMGSAIPTAKAAEKAVAADLRATNGS